MTGTHLLGREAGRKQGCLPIWHYRLRLAQLRPGPVQVGPDADSLVASKPNVAPRIHGQTEAAVVSLAFPMHPLLIFAALLIAAGPMAGSGTALGGDPPSAQAQGDPPALRRPGDAGRIPGISPTRLRPAPVGPTMPRVAGAPAQIRFPQRDRYQLPSVAFPPFPGSDAFSLQPILSIPLQYSQSTATSASSAPPRLHQAFPRDRRVEQKLRSASRNLSNGDLPEALELLQELLDAPDDVLILLDNDEAPRSARFRCLDLISGLDVKSRGLYETLYGGAAEQLRERALKSGEEEALNEVVRRYSHTTAGRKAALALAHLEFDRGHARRAAALVRQLWNDPVHRRHLPAGELIRGAIACEAAGEGPLAVQLARTVEGATVTIAARSLTAEEYFAQSHPVLAVGRNARASVSASALELVAFRPDVHGASVGLQGQHQSVHGSPPVADALVWEASLAGKESAHLESLINAWLHYQQQNALPMATANTPVVDGERLYVRDFEGIRCVATSTGKLLWHFPTRTPLVRDLPAQLAVPVDGNPDPGGIRRLWVGNALAGRLVTDGTRLYAIDSVESRWNQANVIGPDGQDSIAAARQSNRLIALSIEPMFDSASSERMVWSSGGPRSGAATTQAPVSGGGTQPPSEAASVSETAAGVLGGHYFLGVPTVVDGALLAISEFDTQVYVSALRPSDGALLWSRPIAITTTPIHLDQQRYTMSASPVVGDGIVVVPTHAGVLLGLDLLTGTIRWGHEYDDAEQLQLLGAWPNNTRMQHGHAAFPNDPIVHQGRIVYLPPHACEVHCVDLLTGKKLWTERREDQDQSQAIEHVAAADGETVVVVGRLRCRGLDLSTGREVWSRPLSAPPAGRGARQGAAYLVPLANGSIQSFEIATGRGIGVTIVPEAQWTGNLAVGRDVVVGLSAGRLRAWPQALPLLERIEREEPWASRRPQARLLAARTCLALGQTVAAKQELRHILADDQVTDATPVAERLLRELLFVELREQSGDSQGLFGDLESLIGTRTDQGRLLAQRVLYERRQGNVDALFDTSSELMSLSLSSPLVLDHDPALAVATDAWVRAMLTRNLESAPQARMRLAVRLDARRQRAVEEGDETTLRHLALMSDYPEVSQPASLQLATRLWSRGRFQQAELRLLDARQSDDPAVFQEATRRLADLWTERGLYHEAALLWRELDERAVRNGTRADGLNTATVIGCLDPDGMTAKAYGRLNPRVNFGRVPVVREERWVDSRLQATYNGSGIQFLPTPRNSSFDLFDKGKGTGGLLALVDRHSGLEFDESIRIPSRYFYPTTASASFVGHLLPLGSLGAVHGVSLLDREIAWSVTPPGMASKSEVIRVGPSGPTFSVFQCRQHLFAVNPATGDLLWHRTDLESQAGLQADTATGLFGDAVVLTAFRADRNHYTLYDTATGIELGRGLLDADRRQPRKAIGRHLVYMTATGANPGRRLRIWDPESHQLLLDEPAEQLADLCTHNCAPTGMKAYQFVRGTDELAYITVDGRMKVVDVGTGELRSETLLPEELTRQIGLFRITADRDRYYVNLQAADATSGQSQSTFIVSDSTLPVEHFQGHLLTVCRQDGRLLWTQSVGNRSLVSLPEYRLPVLVLLCRARQGNQLAGEMLVLDANTGEELARRSDLSPDRLLQVSYDRDRSRLEFRGARTEISIDFLPAPRWSSNTASR